MEYSGDVGRVLVIIPTYNERENVDSIVSRTRAAVADAHVLIVDDASPDGTGDRADELAADDDHMLVLHRAGKQGLGAAYIAAFRWGLERDYEVLVEMDADGSHRPEDLPRLLAALHDADLVLGSRWVPGGKVVNWSKRREILSRGASIYSRLMLDLPLRDVTGGFRAFQATTLEKIGLDKVESQGYCFQIDLALRAVRAGMRVVEIPITFVDRTRGASKMSRAIMVEALRRITGWGFAYRMAQIRGRGRT